MRALSPTAPVSVARPLRRARRWQLGNLGLAVAVWLAVCLVAGAWVRIETIQTGYAISAQRRERIRLLEEGRKLRLELARLSALDRIEAIASGKLGMKFPSRGQVVRLQ